MRAADASVDRTKIVGARGRPSAIISRIKFFYEQILTAWQIFIHAIVSPTSDTLETDTIIWHKHVSTAQT